VANVLHGNAASSDLRVVFVYGQTLPIGIKATTLDRASNLMPPAALGM